MLPLLLLSLLTAQLLFTISHSTLYYFIFPFLQWEVSADIYCHCIHWQLHFIETQVSYWITCLGVNLLFILTFTYLLKPIFLLFQLYHLKVCRVWTIFLSMEMGYLSCNVSELFNFVKCILFSPSSLWNSFVSAD